MPENEFEKQVQMKMDGLKLTPSEPVWEKIKADINERKRRRYLLMISLTAATLLFGWLGYSYFYTTEKSTTPAQITAAQKSNSDNVINNEDAANENKSTKVTSEQAIDNIKTDADAFVDKSGKKETADGVTKKTGKPVSNASDSKHQSIVVADHLDKTELTTSNKSALASAKKSSTRNSNNEKLFAANNKLEEDVVLNNSKSSFEIKQEAGIQPEYNNLNTSTTSELFAVKDNAPVELQSVSANEFSNKIAANNAPKVNDVLQARIVDPVKFSRKLRWGVSASAGLSSRTNKPLDFGSSSAEKSAAYTNPNINFGTTGSASGGVLILPPSDVKPGAAFKAGVLVEKPLTRRFTVSSGLQYSYSSDHITIGKSLSMPSSGNAFDRTAVAQTAVASNNTLAAAPATRDYTNQYHFVELPVMVGYTINKKWKNPFVWNVGGTVSRLIRTNALLYDIAYGGVYYDGKNDIKKTQVSVFTGFAWRFNVSRLQWSVGPQIAVNTTRLFESAYDNNRHTVSGAINLRLVFPTKKQ